MHHRLMLSRIVTASLLAFNLATASAHNARSDTDPVSAGTGTVTVVGPWELTGLDPSRAGYMFSRMEVVETLLDVDDNGVLKGALASSLSVSADQLQWRFSLRQGSCFHDGSAVTAQAVLAALKRAQARPGVLKLADIQSIEADQEDIVVTLAKRFAPLPYLFTHYTTQVLAPASFSADGSVKSIIGSGPYKITSISLPQQFEVQRFDGWRGPVPRVKRARYLSVSRAETRALMAQSGQADLAFSLDPPSIRRLLAQPNVQLVSATLPRTTFIKLNAGHPFLQDERVRRAISLGIERNGIANALLRDPELGATQLFPPMLQQWHLRGLEPLRTDPAQARQLLKQAGWTPGADGILRRGGERFELKLLTFVDRPELPLIATAIQEEMRQIGIAVRVVVGNSSDIPAGHRSGSLHMGLAARNFGNLPDPIATLLQDFGPAGADWGAMNWTSPALVAALTRLASDAGDAGRQGRPHADDRAIVARELQSGLPVIPVVWYRQTMAVSKRVTGATIDPFERSYRLSTLGWSQ